MADKNYSRRKFIHNLGGTAAMLTGGSVLTKAAHSEKAAFVSPGGKIASNEKVRVVVTGMDDTGKSAQFEIENEAFRLKVDISQGLNPHSLFDKKNNVLLANNDYYYGFGRPREVTIQTTNRPDGGKEIAFTGSTTHFEVIHSFVFPKGEDWFEEYVVLKNSSDQMINLAAGDTILRHGFNNVIYEAGKEHSLSSDWRFLSVPFLINTGSGARQEYTVKDFMAGKPREMASEGWIMTNDRFGILVQKYSQDQMEYAIVGNHLPTANAADIDAGTHLLWGGSGIHHNDPEAAVYFAPDQTLKCGLNRYTSFTGNWTQGFTLFRNFMDSKGHHFPKGFNPPVHWNEIYDNPLWWNAPDTPEKRAEFYRLKDMEAEAAKAAELGCEALYLDPGWDTIMGSTIWANDRLLSCREFCYLMKEKYDLRVSLHTPLAVWNNETAYPPSARKPFAVNNNFLCSGAPGWWGMKRDRLRKLASDGIVFFMFDGTNYTGPCQVKEHYHPIPYTREDHIRNYAQLAQAVHKEFPDILIEMHDQVLGPTPVRYVPIYYTHDSTTFDVIWAFEYMWDPMSDLISGRSKSLYYYNLAYNIPLYDHINLKTDNANALVFWWTASTCRYLGIGGKNGVKASPPSVEVELAHLGIGEKNGPPPKIWEAHKKAMKIYMRLKRFYACGVFYGIDELTHIHTLPEVNSTVINCFNLEKTPVSREITCQLSDLGLEPASEWKLTGTPDWSFKGGAFRFTVEIPARGIMIIEITPG